MIQKKQLRQVKIRVKVKAGAKYDCVSFDEEKKLYLVSTKILPIEERANETVLKVLAGYFKVPKTDVMLKTGQETKIKTFEINRF